jgi:hypothetical protein
MFIIIIIIIIIISLSDFDILNEWLLWWQNGSISD